MAASILNKIEYLVLLVAAFAAQSKISEAEAYRYLSRYGALALCEKLSEPKTGLYFQSSGYVYSFLESELKRDEGCNI